MGCLILDVFEESVFLKIKYEAYNSKALTDCASIITSIIFIDVPNKALLA